MLLALLRANGEVVSRRSLLDEVWGMDFDGDRNFIDIYLTYLRRKLGPTPSRELLQTVRGVGFRLSE